MFIAFSGGSGPHRPDHAARGEVGLYAQLSVVLKDFDLENRRQAKNKMSVSFDQQIWDIYLQLLHQRGEDKFANRLDKWLPDEYRTDFTI